jgi:hypothetical protein
MTARVAMLIINEVRKNMFSQSKLVDRIPAMGAETLQHVRRAVFQAKIWNQSLRRGRLKAILLNGNTNEKQAKNVFDIGGIYQRRLCLQRADQMQL